ncbi:ABC transporter ATP-binding protein [Clostridium sp. KNHs214]|uniref:ABC transporter ATP-binding protein n=1 Tax=Clostridium sp. KNHs214 TaxID=1540257 RepID=UPI000556DC78|nr:ABC transporter ATP-binding protein [Clostridium sp. KNHs214]
MRKGDLKKQIKILRFGLKEVYKLQPWVLPVTIFHSLFESVSPFINIYMSALIIDELLGNKNIHNLKMLVGITILLNLGIHLISTALEHLKGLLIEIVYENQDMKLSEKIANMDYEYVENLEVHKLRTKIKEAQNMNGAGIPLIIQEMGRFIKGLITVITSTFLVIDLFIPKITGGGIPFINSIWFSYVFLIVIFVGTLISLKLTSKAEKGLFKYFNKLMDLNRVWGFYGDMVSDYNVGKGVRLYNEIPIISDELKKFDKNSRKMFNQMGNMKAKYSAFDALISSLSSGMVYSFVALKAIAGAITIGSIVKYVGSINQFMTGSKEVLSSFNEIVNNNKYVELYYDFLNIKGEKHNGTLPVEKRNDDEYQIEFKNVSFKYPGSEIYVLKNVSMKLNIGERLAIVGMNGSGKTTFIKLLCRLYDPNEGEILLNGIDIKKYNYEEYMSLFSIVFQDFKLFSFSLGQNVAATTDYDEKSVVNVVEEVGLKERLNTMSKGVHTSLYKDFDEEGIEISGGEAQKIALARALYRDAPIMILDEPTAALDPISEFEIYSKFNEIVGTKTAFYISHRLSSCRFCDEIAVFHEGRIIQKGNHKNLIKDEEGKYYELWNSQARYYNEKESA